MAGAATAVGVIGNVISILMFMAPVKTLRKIFRSKSTEEFKATPYVCTLLSCMLWTFYGLVKGGILLVTINAAGTALEAAYLAFYFFYADRKRRIKESRSLLAVLVFFAAVVVVTLTATKQKSTQEMISGIISVVFSIIMYASPLRIMKLVVQTKSVTYMPFTLSLVLFLNGGVWSVYAILTKDIYVGIPNCLGMILGALQLTFYGIYWKASKRQEALHGKNSIDKPSKGTAPDTPADANKETTKPTSVSDPQFVSIDMNSPSVQKGHGEDKENLQNPQKFGHGSIENGGTKKPDQVV